jgi:hypothetical protein
LAAGFFGAAFAPAAFGLAARFGLARDGFLPA